MRSSSAPGYATAMRCLTLTQPWCGLVASGIKTDENRPRHIIKREDFGRPFALHAGHEISEEATRRVVELVPELCTDPSQAWWRLASVTSAIVAVATVDDVHDLRTLDGLAWMRVLPAERRRFVFGPVVYSLRDVFVLPSPVPHRGLQGFVRLPPRIVDGREVYPGVVEAAVRAQLPGGGR